MKNKTYQLFYDPKVNYSWPYIIYECFEQDGNVVSRLWSVHANIDEALYKLNSINSSPIFLAKVSQAD